MKLARVFVQEYGGHALGAIHDLIDPNNHPGKVLEGILKEVEVADDFNPAIMTATIHEDGSITFEEDAAKVAAILNGSRESKLSYLRSLRVPKLAEVDVMVNDLALGDTALTQVQIKDYRQELKSVTDPFKNYATDEEHATAIDALDVAAFTWPTKPTA